MKEQGGERGREEDEFSLEFIRGVLSPSATSYQCSHLEYFKVCSSDRVVN